jgi:acyl phosphate:glycerol-3-phosphate acyltransferase
MPRKKDTVRRRGHLTHPPQRRNRMMIDVLKAAGLAYLIGSIPVGLMISLWVYGKDPRLHHSGRIGATNVYRTTRSRFALVSTMIFDAVKGIFVVDFVGHKLLTGSEFLWPGVALAALFVLIGDIYPFPRSFKGGAGGAVIVGILLALNPPVGTAVIMSTLIVWYATRHAFMATTSASLFILAATWQQTAMPEPEASLPWLGFFGVAQLCITLWTLRGNFRRYIQGERRPGF